MEDFWKFSSHFRYNPEKALWVGVEREGFIFNSKGDVRPMTYLILQSSDSDSRFTYELSACQIESRIGPCRLSDLGDSLQITEDALNKYVSVANRCIGILPGLADWLRDDPEKYLVNSSYYESLGLHVRYISVAPESMPLDVYPEESGRYQEITKNMPKDILSAACRVAGTHIHIGMPSPSVAIKVYNRVISNLNHLCIIGDNSNGFRLSLYKKMAPDYLPIPYMDWENFCEMANQKGFASDPRRCWHLIRLSVHGTIEFRMFGSSPDLNIIGDWAKMCHNACKEAMSC